jgi:hypothetical protein
LSRPSKPFAAMSVAERGVVMRRAARAALRELPAGVGLVVVAVDGREGGLETNLSATSLVPAVRMAARVAEGCQGFRG